VPSACPRAAPGEARHDKYNDTVRRQRRRSRMNRGQHVSIAVTLVNLAVVLLFPPFDYQSVTRGSMATFQGFAFLLDTAPNRAINSSFLYIEVFVVLINGLIAWLLTRRGPLIPRMSIDYQRVILIVVAVNLILVMLFPPFENVSKVTKAVLPSFDGFYFVSGDNSHRFIVTPILWLEVIFIVVNGALFWLLLKDRNREQLSADEIRRLSNELKKRK
jgi:hypothetical protein